MKLNYKLVLTLVSLGALLTASCQKETLDQNPQASLEASTAIKDAATVNAATLVFRVETIGVYVISHFPICMPITLTTWGPSHPSAQFGMLQYCLIIPR